MTEPMPQSLDSLQPPQAGKDVRLENFEGPLDLLLYLIKKSDLDVYDIPIAQITHEYLSYLDLMKELNLEAAGEFLVMAATLMQIKAQMLLPAPETEGEEGPDPRAELMNKLLEYQQFKEASTILSRLNERAKDVFFRDALPSFGEDDYILKASVFDLLNAFKKILQERPKEVGQILRDEVPLDVRIKEVQELVSAKGSLSFEELFEGRRRKIDLIITFMALLELIRLKDIIARQSENFGPIRIYKADAAPAEEVVPPVTDSEPQPAAGLVPLGKTIDETPAVEAPAENVSDMSLEDLARLETDVAAAAPAAEQLPLPKTSAPRPEAAQENPDAPDTLELPAEETAAGSESAVLQAGSETQLVAEIKREAGSPAEDAPAAADSVDEDANRSPEVQS